MKRLGLALAALTLATGCAGTPTLDAMKRFQEAEEAFRSAQAPEDFLRTAALYQAILDAGTISGAILYNQGNAYTQAGKRGPAIAAYRRAQRYRPRDPFLEANLKTALGDATPAEERRPVIETIFFWQNWLSWPEKFHVAFAAALAAFLLGLAALARPARRGWRHAALAALAPTVLLLLSGWYDGVRFGEARGVLSATEVVARKGNSAAYEPAFTEPLREGMEFTIVEERAGWLRVRLAGGLEGWIPQDDAVAY